MNVVAEVREPGFTRKKITFAAEPGDRVPAWLLIPDASRDGAVRRPAVLCLHQTIAIGKDEPVGLGTNLELAYARELAGRGYVALAPDYPNFGEYKVDAYGLGYSSATMKADLEQYAGHRFAVLAAGRRPRPDRRDRPLARRS